jgi:hypothetical protein
MYLLIILNKLLASLTGFRYISIHDLRLDFGKIGYEVW